MPLFMDRHELSGVTAVDAAGAHLQDLAVQDRFGVRYLTYWFDYERQRAYCLARGPDREAVQAVHAASHGMLAHQITEVEPQDVERSLGPLIERPHGEPFVASAFRTILFHGHPRLHPAHPAPG